MSRRRNATWAAVQARLVGIRCAHSDLRGLISGPEGLDDIAGIVAHAPYHLEAGGWIFIEHGYDQAHRVRGLLADAGFAGFAGIASWRDLAGIERVSGGQWLGRGSSVGK